MVVKRQVTYLTSKPLDPLSSEFPFHCLKASLLFQKAMHKFCYLLSAIKEIIEHRQAGGDLLHDYFVFYSS